MDNNTSELNKNTRLGDPEYYNFEFYFDYDQIEEEYVDFEDTTNFVLVEVGTEEDLYIIRYNIFSTQSSYFDYGRTIGVDLTVYQTIEDILSSEAILSGVIDYTERYEYIPQWWTDFEENIIDSLLDLNSIFTDKSWAGVLHSQCIGGNNLFLIPNLGQPWLAALGWNNSVSVFTPLFTGLGVHILYDRSFYRSRVITFVNRPGTIRVPFCGGLSSASNRASSWFNFGL